MWIIHDSADAKDDPALEYYRTIGHVDAFPEILTDGTRVYSNPQQPAVQVRVTTMPGIGGR